MAFIRMKRSLLPFLRGTKSQLSGKASPAETTADVPGGTAASRLPALTCRLCGQIHAPVTLRRGQRALCVRCHTLLARKSWIGGDATLAFTVTGLICAVPALVLPIATVSKFGNNHASGMFTGIVALWHNDMRLLAVWAAICGACAPILLLGILAGHALSARLGAHHERNSLAHAAHALEHWAMPEVHILAVLVSFVKLGSLVDVSVGAGLWCYAAMSVATLMAWRSFELEPEHATEIPVSTLEVAS